MSAEAPRRDDVRGDASRRPWFRVFVTLAVIGLMALLELQVIDALRTMHHMSDAMDDVRATMHNSTKRSAAFGEELGELSPQLRLINRRLGRMEREIRYVRQLPGLRRDLAPLPRISATTRRMESRLAEVAATLRSVPRLLQSMHDVLRHVERHVHDIYRKTGPTPPVEGPTGDSR